MTTATAGHVPQMWLMLLQQTQVAAPTRDVSPGAAAGRERQQSRSNCRLFCRPFISVSQACLGYPSMSQIFRCYPYSATSCQPLR